MALTKRKADEKTSKTFYVHSGVFPFKVVAFNPGLKQLKALGRNFEEEPEYIVDDNLNEGKKQFKATFWLSNKEITGKNEKGKEVTIKEGSLVTPFTFYISEVDQVSQDGAKTKFINKWGQGMFAESKDDLPDFYESTGARVAKRGEEELMTFMFSYANLMKEDENVLEDPNKLFEDDSEIRDTVEALMEEGNIVRCLVGMKGSDGERGLNVNQNIYRGFYRKKGERSVVPFKSFINCENVSEQNKQDKLDRRKPNFDYYTFEPVQMPIDEAREIVKQNMENPDKDGDQTEDVAPAPEMEDVDADF